MTTAPLDRQARFQLAQLGGAIGDPSRAAMLVALMGGRALPAGDLARCAGVAASTAAGHLRHLLSAGLVSVQRRGRHRYYRLAEAPIAAQLERLAMVGLGPDRARSRVPSALVDARLCYAHLAGRLAVALWTRARSVGWVEWDGGVCALQPKGRAALTQVGLELPLGPTLLGQRCLDWSERVPHVSGPLGIAVTRALLERGWLARRAEGRALRVTARGGRGLAALGVSQA